VLERVATDGDEFAAALSDSARAPLPG